VTAIVLDVVCVALLLHTVVNALLLRRPARAAEVEERVSILLPMRNEARRLTPTVTSVLAQQGLADVEVLGYDDDSTDGTADVVRRVAGERVRLLPTNPLPGGWLGKPHACAVLSGAATGSVLVFVDADVVLTPDAVAGAVAAMRTHTLDFVSPYPRQLAGSWLERLVQPLLTWSWLTFLPLRLAERGHRPSLANANGQLLVVDTAAYRRAGGHASVRAEVVDDVALARSLRRIGARGGFIDGSHVARCRMYDGSRMLVDGYAKSLWTAFGSPLGAAGVSVLLLALYVLPWVLTPFTPWAWIGAGSGVAGRVVAATRTGGSVLDAVLHPLSVLAFVALAAVSTWRRRRHALTWKDRVLP